VPECPNCGEAVPAGARFCPECGLPVEGEAGVAPRRARWWQNPFLLIVALVFVAAVFLFVGREWAWGLVALFAAGLLFLSQREAERRAARWALADLRARLTASRESWAARSRGQLELFRARRERAELEATRARGLQELGRAVFEKDKKGIAEAKANCDAVVEGIREKEAEIETLLRNIEARVQRAQAGVRPTVRLEQPPEPARVPEPWPPPDEGEPPSPEPVPEPSPGEPVPEPEHPPMPQTRGRKKR
jgi:predicted nucleic acid-binding Zn ribbon protein